MQHHPKSIFAVVPDLCHLLSGTFRGPLKLVTCFSKAIGKE